MDSENEVTDGKAGTFLAIPQSVQRAAGEVIHQAFERLLSSDVQVTTAAEGKRLLAADDDTEQMTDSIQRFVGRDTSREDRTAWRTVHAHPMGARGVLERVDRRHCADRCSGAPDARRVAGSPL